MQTELISKITNEKKDQALQLKTKISKMRWCLLSCKAAVVSIDVLA